MRTFAFDKVPDALHVLRAGTHMGKLVVSRDAGEALSIPVRLKLILYSYRIGLSDCLMIGPPLAEASQVS
jgi:hypothetical protein